MTCWPLSRCSLTVCSRWWWQQYSLHNTIKVNGIHFLPLNRKHTNTHTLSLSHARTHTHTRTHTYTHTHTHTHTLSSETMSSAAWHPAEIMLKKCRHWLILKASFLPWLMPRWRGKCMWRLCIRRSSFSRPCREESEWSFKLSCLSWHENGSQFILLWL